MEKIIASYTENPEVLKVVAFLIFSFSWTLVGALFSYLRDYNSSKRKPKKVSIRKKISKTTETTLTCFFISIFVTLYKDKLDENLLKIMLVSIILGIANEKVSSKITEEDFWEKLLKYIFASAKEKYNLFLDFFNKKGPLKWPFLLFF